MKLYIVNTQPEMPLQIADEQHRIVATLPRDQMAVARRIVRAFNLFSWVPMNTPREEWLWGK